MKLPGNLLNSVSGKKTNGATVFAAVLMVIASVGGVIWGLYIKIAPPTQVAFPGKGVNVDPGKHGVTVIPKRDAPSAQKPKYDPCGAICGMG